MRTDALFGWPRIVLVAAGILLVAVGCGGSSGSSKDQEQAIAAADEVYQQAKANGTDFSNGPCIAEKLPNLPDWSVDVAHEPRQAIDDQPENQCQFYRDGKTHHFVELDPEGLLIRAQ